MPRNIDKLYQNLTVDERMSLLQQLGIKATLNKQEGPSLVLEMHKIRDSTPSEQVNEYVLKHQKMMEKVNSRMEVSRGIEHAFLNQLLAEEKKKVLFADMKMFTALTALKLNIQGKNIDFEKVVRDMMLTPEFYKYTFDEHGVPKGQEDMFKKFPNAYSEFAFLSILKGECERFEKETLPPEERKELDELESKVTPIDSDYSEEEWSAYCDKSRKLLKICTRFDEREEEILEMGWQNKKDVEKLLEFDKELLDRFKSDGAKTSNEIFQILTEFTKKHEPEVFEFIKQSYPQLFSPDPSEVHSQRHHRS